MHTYIRISILIVIVIFLSILLTSCSVLTPKPHNVEFYDEFSIRPKADYIYIVTDSFGVEVDETDIMIPRNFETDLASVPRWYWSFIAPISTELVAPAILHDYLYSCPAYFTREEIDDIFYWGLIANGVSEYTSYQMYIVIRIFGGRHFHEAAVECTVPATFD